MAVWVARGSYGNLRATGFLNRRNRFFSSRKARPPWRIFSSRKDAEPQRNCGALGLTFRRGGLDLQPAPQNCWGLPYFAACPAELRGAILFFLLYSRKDLPAVGRRRAAKKLWYARFDFRRPWLLCSLPRRNSGPPRRAGACQPRLVQIPISKHKNQGLTLNRGSIVVSA